MDPIHAEDNVLHTHSRGGRAQLLLLAALMLAAGAGLAAAAGPPRLPPHVPEFDDVLKILAGATLPLDALLLVLVDAAWVVWAWIVLSLLLQSLLGAADLLTHGSSQWVRSLRGFVDRASVPLARRAVAAAFAVQVISRGVPIASAQTLPPPVETVVVSASNSDADPVASANDPSDSTPTYLVRSGDTLWSIAEQAYGAGTEYRRLLDANVGRPMSDGQVFSARGVIRPGWRLLVPGASWQVEEVDGQRWYTVGPGDTLSSVADATLGDPLRWPEVFDLNRGAATDDGRHVLRDANTIWPGLRLRLPDPPGDPDQVPDPPDAPAAEAVPAELSAASTPMTVADRYFDDTPTVPATPATSEPAAPEPDPDPVATPSAPPPLLRTHHSFQPVVLDPADAPSPTQDTGQPRPPRKLRLPARPTARRFRCPLRPGDRTCLACRWPSADWVSPVPRV